MLGSEARWCSVHERIGGWAVAKKLTLQRSHSKWKVTRPSVAMRAALRQRCCRCLYAGLGAALNHWILILTKMQSWSHLNEEKALMLHLNRDHIILPTQVVQLLYFQLVNITWNYNRQVKSNRNDFDFPDFSRSLCKSFLIIWSYIWAGDAFHFLSFK